MRRLCLLLFTLASAASAQPAHPWLTTEWRVACQDPARVTVQAMCDDESSVSTASFVRDQLGQASVWLSGLGFYGPSVELDPTGPRPGPQYRASIGGDSLLMEDIRVAGYFMMSDPPGVLVVDATHEATFGGQPDRTGTATHEMFHAVQASYPSYGVTTRAHRWLIEGMARAVELAYRSQTDGVALFELDGTPGPLITERFGSRDFGLPLNLPDDAHLNQSYATNHFWLALGEMIGSRDRIAYLHTVLLAVDGPDGGIRGVDGALRQFEPGGLYTLFPRFIARYGVDSRFYTSASEQTPTVAGRSESVRELSVEANAARFIRIPVTPPPGVTLGVTVTLSDVVNAHLVVGSEVYSQPDPLRPDAPRNEFRTAVTQPDTLVVRLVNINVGAAGRSPSTFTLTVRAEPLDACTAGPMMATLGPDFLRVNGLLPGTVIGGVVSRGMIQDAALYQREFEVAETAPAPGSMRVSGLASDGGTVCGEPIGTSPTWAAVTLGKMGEVEAAMMDPTRQAAMMQRMMARMASMTEAEQAGRADSTFALGAQVGAWSNDAMRGMGLGSEMVGDEIGAIVGPHIAFRVFSPNGFSWQMDAVPAGDSFLEHSGHGGWRANAGMAVNVILPGVDVAHLRVGETVPARLAANPDDDDEDAPVLYSNWTGQHTPIADGTHAFEGEVVAVRSAHLIGTFRVTEITGAEVRGDLRLTGTAHRLTEQHRYTRTDGRIDGSRIEDDQERTGSITVEATVRLPAAVEVTRPGRFVERTARVGSRH